MDLTVSGDVLDQVFATLKKDRRMAQVVAEQILRRVELHALAEHLITREIAVDLLVRHLQQNPERALRLLEGLPKPTERARLKPGRPGRKATPPAGRQKRHRLTAGEIAKLKQQVLAYLSSSPWSNRKQISAAVRFPSLAAYNRILGELRRANAVRAKGTKSLTTYALSGQKGAAKGTKASAAPAKAAKSKKRVTRPAKAQAVRAKKARPPSVKKSAKPSKLRATKAPRAAAAPAERKPRSKRSVFICSAPGCTSTVAAPGSLCEEHQPRVVPEAPIVVETFTP